ncbi:MAG: hypothetical protein CM1200mP1_08350 [Candidatus Neomarinimicrobiota bacterium]|nr:MAG: hypothetical protein CM1200mP1_08350 [Candidatus Neomarinimicrobiota bacterium]
MGLGVNFWFSLFYAAIHAFFFFVAIWESMMNIEVGTQLDKIVIFVYFALVMGFGAYFGKNSKSTSDYFFGGKRFAWWLITISIVATGVGSHSFVKYSTKAYQYGLSSTMTYLNDWFFMPLFMFGWFQLFITQSSFNTRIL